MPLPSTYARKLADTAFQQHEKFHMIHETDPSLAAQIKRFWTEIGFSFPGVKTAWSAVFVSWCVFKAGATAQEFKFAQSHSKFVNWAIQNAANGTGLFQAFDIDSHGPQVGDIIQNNRNKHKFSFNFAKNNKNYESHSAVVVEIGQDSDGNYALTIGGNEGDSIRRKLVRLRANGLVKQRDLDPFICVIRNLK